MLAGRATTALRLPVSVQIVLRALIEEGLKRNDSAALMTNFERQATAVRDIRRAVRVRPRAVAVPSQPRELSRRGK